MQNKQLSISSEWNKDQAMFVRRKLIEYNQENVTENVNEAINENVSVILKDDNDNILGGITGNIYWNCLHIDIFWIDKEIRGQGQGKRLLKAAEKLAKDNGCTLVKLDTFSFQAPDFYKKQGFEIFGILENFPEGFNQYHLFKRI
jgi:GNAT superfamily N-acetyltransferase